MRTQLDRIDAQVQDHRDKFDTLETPLWKRLWFRAQRWPGQRDLNAVQPGYLPAWLRRIVGQ